MTKRRDPTWKLLLASILMLLLIWSVTASTARRDELRCFHVYDVPYVGQSNNYWCGPASLVMVFGYWGANVTQEEIAAEIYDSRARLTDISAMESYPLEHGFRTEEVNGSIECLKKWITKGCPVIVLQEVSAQTQYGHYRVTLGYNDEQETVKTFDPIFGSNYNITYSKFTELSKPGTTFQTCNWTLLVIPRSPFLTSQAEKRQLFFNRKASSTQQPMKPEEGYLIAVCLILALLSASFDAKTRASQTREVMEALHNKQNPQSPSRQEQKEDGHLSNQTETELESH